ncbi:hypothetical protein EU528_07210 [Candidatus Thorarchaeota archaeon]|nr:MAG: hypothetical protein EU528_07210 [Candidatus Thorarchaeota archaeon]
MSEQMDDAERWEPDASEINRMDRAVFVISFIHMIAGILSLANLPFILYYGFIEAPLVIMIIKIIFAVTATILAPLMIILGFAVSILHPRVWKIAVVANILGIFVNIGTPSGILNLILVYALLRNDVKEALLPFDTTS